MNGAPLGVATGLAAAAPVVLLLVLVLWGRWGGVVPAAASLLTCLGLALTVFQADLPVLSVALAKGAWLALWILLVVWPALLLFRVASVAGLERLGRFFSSILPRRRQNLLIVAWIFPSFIQGVAGFGTPIAVAAPLLLAMGWGPARAVAYPLIGYHWSVTFGSMGSSFYMASLTAHLDADGRTGLAVTAATMLAVNCLAGGALVLLLDGGLRGLREGVSLLFAAGLPMAGTLIAVAGLVPAVASSAAGSVGFLVILTLRAAHQARRRRSTGEPADPVHTARATTPAGNATEQPVARNRNAGPLLLLAPYAYLLLVALPVFLLPASRDWVQHHLRIAPGFAGTSTGLGWSNPAVDDYNPLAVLAHPGAYIALAVLLGFLTFRARGLWQSPHTDRLFRDWLRAIPKSSYSILLLACLATLMVDAGMVSVLAAGCATLAGDAYAAFAPALGALGSFMTGSTTSSNALLSSFQAQVAHLVGVDEVLLVAAQTAGGNVGNSLAPVVVLVGAAAVGAPRVSGSVIRLCLPAGLFLLLVVSASTMVGTALFRP